MRVRGLEAAGRADCPIGCCDCDYRVVVGPGAVFCDRPPRWGPPLRKLEVDLDWHLVAWGKYSGLDRAASFVFVSVFAWPSPRIGGKCLKKAFGNPIERNATSAMTLLREEELSFN